MRAKHALRKDVEKCAFICAPVPQDFVPQMMAIWLYSGKFDEKGQNLIENRLNLMANDGESAQMWCFSAISTFFRPFSTFILTSALKLLRLGHNWGTNWGTRRYAEISLKHISVGFGTDFDKFMTSATFKKMVRNNPKKRISVDFWDKFWQNYRLSAGAAVTLPSDAVTRRLNSPRPVEPLFNSKMDRFRAKW